jgi:hypothetical protein
MTIYPGRGLRRALLAASALSVAAIAGLAHAAEQSEAQAAAATPQTTALDEVVVTAARTTRSAVTIPGREIQKILPGINPLKAIQTLPGVVFETADPWGNNEQNETLYVHGFSLQQLGFTFDGVPLGDQQYGNYNGLSPSRAVTSENVRAVTLESGAGDLATPATSNLGGTIATVSADPTHEAGVHIAETAGSYQTTRTFLRAETGDLGFGDLYLSYLHQSARAWDFDGFQRDDQVNVKFVHEDPKGKLTLFYDFDTKYEPNEDSIVYGPNDPNPPYTRPFLYPNIGACIAYVAPNGTPPAAAKDNFSNCFSAAQRLDDLGYAKYEYKVAPDITLTSQVYGHYDYGRGIVAGAINQAGLPGLFSAYYPADTSSQLINVFGGEGYAVRTTEYLIDRGGLINNADWDLGNHHIEGGLWWEHNYATATRVWYPFAATSNDLSPYSIPTNYNFIQYKSVIENNVVQFHLQDAWRIIPSVLLQAGFKSSLQFADGYFPINQVNPPGVTPASNSYVHYPSGEINTLEWFLPQAGVVWDATRSEQLFLNVQNNVRQFITYGASGLSPWSLPTQTAFNLFKQDTKPETSWTYEVGLRENREVNFGVLTGIQGQVEYYHVDFYDRLLQISSTPVILSLVSGPSILANVGSVKTDGVDVAATLHFGPHISVYDALSYNRSVYQGNYVSGTATVPTAGKIVPGDPQWANKFIASTVWGPFDAQVSGEFIGRRFATYTNDLSVPSYFIVGLEAGYRIDVPPGHYVKGARISLNITNIGDEKGVSTVVVGAASGTYNVYPLPPIMAFATVQADF